MSKDRDGFSDDESLASGASRADDMSTGSASDIPADAAEALRDPESAAPDALAVGAEIEAATESAELESAGLESDGSVDSGIDGPVGLGGTSDDDLSDSSELVRGRRRRPPPGECGFGRHRQEGRSDEVP